MTNISYELLCSEVEQYKRINLSHVNSVIEKLASEIMESYEEDIYEFSPSKKLKDMADWIGSSLIKYIGDTNDFHNISVAYAHLNMYVEACVVLERGLSEAPMNIDLIADIIQYSIKCGSDGMKRSQKYYKRLKTISDNEWNWRAFSFSLNYLTAEFESTVNSSKRTQLKKEIFELSDTFITKKNSDRAYFAKAEVYKYFGDSDKERAILDEAVEKLTSAQLCRFRLADIEFEKGHYQTSINMLKACLFDFKMQDVINKGAAFLILAMNRASIYFGKSDKRLLDEDRTEIESIYSDIDSARSYGLDSFENIANILEKVIGQQTGIEPERGDQEASFSDEDEFEF